MSNDDFRQNLRRLIAGHFNQEELRTLVFDVNLNWDELAGGTLSGKIVSLIEKMERDGRLPDLLTQLSQRYPDVNWPRPASVVVSVEQVKRGNVSDLSGAMLRRAVLNGVNLSGANLRGANLHWAKLYLADLSGADLREADCRGAKMRKANLAQADLRGARLNGADLRLADLRGAKISAAQMEQIGKLKGAILPNGQLFDPERPLSEQLT